jgi:hypothetical protein
MRGPSGSKLGGGPLGAALEDKPRAELSPPRSRPPVPAEAVKKNEHIQTNE